MHTFIPKHCEEIINFSEQHVRSRFSSKSTAESVEASDFLEWFGSDLSAYDNGKELFPTSLYGCKAGLAISSDYLNPKDYGKVFKPLTDEQRTSLSNHQQNIEKLLHDLEDKIEPVSVGDDICCPKPVLINCTRSSLLMRRRTQEHTTRVSLQIEL